MLKTRKISELKPIKLSHSRNSLLSIDNSQITQKSRVRQSSKSPQSSQISHKSIASNIHSKGLLTKQNNGQNDGLKQTHKQYNSQVHQAFVTKPEYFGMFSHVSQNKEILDIQIQPHQNQQQSNQPSQSKQSKESSKKVSSQITTAIVNQYHRSNSTKRNGLVQAGQTLPRLTKQKRSTLGNVFNYSSNEFKKPIHPLSSKLGSKKKHHPNLYFASDLAQPVQNNQGSVTDRQIRKGPNQLQLKSQVLQSSQTIEVDRSQVNSQQQQTTRLSLKERSISAGRESILQTKRPNSSKYQQILRRRPLNKDSKTSSPVGRGFSTDRSIPSTKRKSIYQDQLQNKQSQKGIKSSLSNTTIETIKKLRELKKFTGLGEKKQNFNISIQENIKEQLDKPFDEPILSSQQLNHYYSTCSVSNKAVAAVNNKHNLSQVQQSNPIMRNSIAASKQQVVPPSSSRARPNQKSNPVRIILADIKNTIIQKQNSQNGWKNSHFVPSENDATPVIAPECRKEALLKKQPQQIQIQSNFAKNLNQDNSNITTNNLEEKQRNPQGNSVFRELRKSLNSQSGHGIQYVGKTRSRMSRNKENIDSGLIINSSVGQWTNKLNTNQVKQKDQINKYKILNQMKDSIGNTQCGPQGNIFKQCNSSNQQKYEVNIGQMQENKRCNMQCNYLMPKRVQMQNGQPPKKGIETYSHSSPGKISGSATMQCSDSNESSSHSHLQSVSSDSQYHLSNLPSQKVIQSLLKKGQTSLFNYNNSNSNASAYQSLPSMILNQQHNRSDFPKHRPMPDLLQPSQIPKQPLQQCQKSKNLPIDVDQSTHQGSLTAIQAAPSIMEYDHTSMPSMRLDQRLVTESLGKSYIINQGINRGEVEMLIVDIDNQKSFRIDKQINTDSYDNLSKEMIVLEQDHYNQDSSQNYSVEHEGNHMNILIQGESSSRQNAVSNFLPRPSLEQDNLYYNKYKNQSFKSDRLTTNERSRSSQDLQQQSQIPKFNDITSQKQQDLEGSEDQIHCIDVLNQDSLINGTFQLDHTQSFERRGDIQRSRENQQSYMTADNQAQQIKIDEPLDEEEVSEGGQEDQEQDYDGSQIQEVNKNESLDKKYQDEKDNVTPMYHGPSLHAEHFQQTQNTMINLHLLEPYTQAYKHLFKVQLPEPNASLLEVWKKEEDKQVDTYLKHSNFKVLFLDIDETMVHCIDDRDPQGIRSEVRIRIDIPQRENVEQQLSGKEAQWINIDMNVRPGLKECLMDLKNYYQIVSFTASDQTYADAILNYIDPNSEIFCTRLYRQHCVETEYGLIKDLRIIDNRQLKDMVIVDNSALSFAFNDEELKHLSYYLICLVEGRVEDVRVHNDNAFGLIKYSLNGDGLVHLQTMTSNKMHQISQHDSNHHSISKEYLRCDPMEMLDENALNMSSNGIEQMQIRDQQNGYVDQPINLLNMINTNQVIEERSNEDGENSSQVSASNKVRAYQLEQCLSTDSNCHSQTNSDKILREDSNIREDQPPFEIQNPLSNEPRSLKGYTQSELRDMQENAYSQVNYKPHRQIGKHLL